MGTLVGLIFTYFPFLIPVKKIMINKNAIALPHPASSYPNHVLIIPRKVARSIFYLTKNDIDGIIGMAIKIRGSNHDYSLLINGGSRQDVMQAHFHLFDGSFTYQKGLSKNEGKCFNHFNEESWKEFISGLRGLNAFSIIIQVERDNTSNVYVI